MLLNIASWVSYSMGRMYRKIKIVSLVLMEKHLRYNYCKVFKKEYKEKEGINPYDVR